MTQRLLLLLVLLATPLQGQVFRNRCQDRGSGEFGLGAYALYWKPVACDQLYALQPVEGGDVALANKPDIQWGFAIFGLYRRNCFYSRLSYRWLQTRDTSPTVDGVAVGLGGLDQQPLADEVIARLQYDYQRVDLQFGQSLKRKKGSDFTLFGNVRWVDIRQRRWTEGDLVNGTTPGPFTFMRKAAFGGVGLGVGASGEQCVINGFSLFGSFGFMAIIGQRKTESRDLLTASLPEALTVFPPRTAVLPAADIRAGLNYSLNWCCLRLVGEIGYEVNYYWEALESVVYGSQVQRACSDLGFAGPFAGLHIHF